MEFVPSTEHFLNSIFVATLLILYFDLYDPSVRQKYTHNQLVLLLENFC